jgi:transposase InsO family protein
MSVPDRRKLVDCSYGSLSIRRQSDVYRPPPAANDDDLSVMPRIDELFTAWPFLGLRRMTALVRAEGHAINRKRVQRLMRKMGIAALGPKPRTTKSAPGHKIFPYLLRGLTIDRPNQVWCADITYIPIGRGFLDLVAIIMDWLSRAELAWRLSNTMDSASPSRRLRKRSLALADQRSSIPTRAVSLQVLPSPVAVCRRCAQRTAAADDGQHVHRAAVALPQTRGHLLEGLC